MPSPKTIVIFLFILIFGIQPLLNRMFNPTHYKGPWYTVAIPADMEKTVEKDEVIFKTEEMDLFTNMPHAVFSIYTQKPKGPLWVEDLMVEVYASLAKMPGRILDRGEIKVDKNKAKWVLFHNKEPSILILSFYVVDDMGRFTKIQFISPTDHFRDYREKFEEFKGSIVFKKLF